MQCIYMYRYDYFIRSLKYLLGVNQTGDHGKKIKHWCGGRGSNKLYTHTFRMKKITHWN